MANDTNSNGELIRKVTLEEVVQELSSWTPDSVVVLAAGLIVTHHAAEYDELIEGLKKELKEG